MQTLFKRYHTMTKTIFSLIIYVLAATTAMADGPWRKRPLTFVAPDSVVTWDYSGSSFSIRALSRDSTLRTPRFAVTEALKEKRDNLERMGREMAANLNIVGGGEDARKTPQGIPAMMNMSTNAYIFLLTGRADYMDLVERSFYNALLQTSECTWLPFRQPDRHGSFEALLAVGGMLYATEGNDLYVNLYTNATANVTLEGTSFVVDQITDMPATGRVRLRFTKLHHPTRFRLHLRMPDWLVHRKPAGTPYTYAETATALPKIYVSGFEAEGATMDADGYVVIDRTWQRLDEVYFEFPLTPQLLRASDTEGRAVQRGKVAIQCGPLVYAVEGETEGFYFSANDMPTATGEITTGGLPVLNVPLYRSEGTPADAAAPRSVRRATPFCENTDSVGTLWIGEAR